MGKPHEDALAYERLVEVLSYSPETGEFYWLVRPNNRMKAGDKAGSTKDPYSIIHIDERRYMAHRLAWFYTYREWPPEYIDHINGNTRDNRIANLRLASPRQNAYNWARKNRSGVRGVHWTGWQWKAQIKLPTGKMKVIGSFYDKAEAAAAYDRAAREIHGEFAVTNGG